MSWSLHVSGNRGAAQDVDSPSSECWLWQGAKTRTGYGQMLVRNLVTGTKHMMMVHRLSYEAFKEPIPEGLEIDHLCGVHGCYNPDHLEVVTHLENVRRWAAKVTHCPQGHEYTPENTNSYPTRTGGVRRNCRTCGALAAKKSHQNARARVR